jgi:hypothetical protein
LSWLKFERNGVLGISGILRVLKSIRRLKSFQKVEEFSVRSSNINPSFPQT